MNKLKSFLKDYPLISWNIIAILSLFIHWSIALIFFWVSLFFYAKRRKHRGEERKKTLITEAEKYIAEVKKNRTLPRITPSILLKDGEFEFLKEDTTLHETRAVRKYGGGGLGFRVAKGVYLGGYSGSSESHKEWRALDRGKLILTNQKLIFKGDKENRLIPLDTIFSIEAYRDGIEVSIESRAKSIVFPVANPYIWSAAIQILRSVRNPLDIKDLHLDIKFQ